MPTATEGKAGSPPLALDKPLDGVRISGMENLLKDKESFKYINQIHDQLLIELTKTGEEINATVSLLYHFFEYKTYLTSGFQLRDEDFEELKMKDFKAQNLNFFNDLVERLARGGHDDFANFKEAGYESKFEQFCVELKQNELIQRFLSALNRHDIEDQRIIVIKLLIQALEGFFLLEIENRRLLNQSAVNKRTDQVDKAEFQKWVQDENIIIDRITDLWSIESINTEWLSYSKEILKNWYKEAQPKVKLKSGRPK